MPFEQDIAHFLEHHPEAPGQAIVATRLLMRAATLMREHLDQALEPHGLAMRDYLALAIISLHEAQTLRPSDLSVSLDATRTQITRLIDGLVDKGLVLRLHSTEDRRALQLRLTEDGGRLVAAVAPQVHAAYQQAWADTGDLEATLQSLRRINQRLQSGPEPEDAP
ncbi:MAG: MarR family transcriptional regulator [Curvibacter sp.]|nr:MarR family transcriptional regulator [Curvibacter sp.]